MLCLLPVRMFFLPWPPLKKEPSTRTAPDQRLLRVTVPELLAEISVTTSQFLRMFRLAQTSWTFAGDLSPEHILTTFVIFLAFIALIGAVNKIRDLCCLSCLLPISAHVSQSTSCWLPAISWLLGKTILSGQLVFSLFLPFFQQFSDLVVHAPLPLQLSIWLSVLPPWPICFFLRIFVWLRSMAQTLITGFLHTCLCLLSPQPQNSTFTPLSNKLNGVSALFTPTPSKSTSTATGPLNWWLKRLTPLDTLVSGLWNNSFLESWSCSWSKWASYCWWLAPIGSISQLLAPSLWFTGKDFHPYHVYNPDDMPESTEMTPPLTDRSQPPARITQFAWLLHSILSQDPEGNDSILRSCSDCGVLCFVGVSTFDFWLPESWRSCLPLSGHLANLANMLAQRGATSSELRDGHSTSNSSE